MKGVERRKDLTTLFSAISAAELKAGVKAGEGRKEEMVEMLINRYGPKKKRKRAPAAAAAAAAELPADVEPLGGEAEHVDPAPQSRNEFRKMSIPAPGQSEQYRKTRTLLLIS